MLLTNQGVYEETCRILREQEFYRALRRVERQMAGLRAGIVKRAEQEAILWERERHLYDPVPKRGAA
jgi:hypothetical protein